MAINREQLLEKMLRDEEEQRLASRKLIEDQLASEMQNRITNVDISPVGAMLDAIHGTNQAAALQQGYQNINKQDERIDDLYDQLVSTQSKGQASIPSALLSDPTKQNSVGGRFDSAATNTIEKEIQSDYTRNIIDPLNERKQQFTVMQAALNSGDVQQIQMILGQFARGISGEKGVLTDRDIARVFPETATQMMAKWKAFITGQEPADPKIIQKSQMLLDIARNNAQKVYGDLSDKKKAQYLARTNVKKYNLGVEGGVLDTSANIVKDTIQEFANTRSAGIEEEPSEVQTAPTLSLDAIRAERAKRKGK